MPRTSLYRHFDAQGRLLYVGVSLCAVARLSWHMKYSRWSSDICRIDVEWHPSRVHALYAEALAIQNESPIHNARLLAPDQLKFPDDAIPR